MDDIQQPNPKAEALKRELQRQSLDIIRVFNPTDENFVTDWDGFKHVIPAREYKDLPRYIARKYIKDMKDKLINEMQEKELISLKAKLEKQGVDDVTFKAQELLMRKNNYRTDDPKLIAEIYPKLWKGVISKYGLDELPDEAPSKIDNRPIEDRILADLDKPYVEEVKTDYPINKKKAVEEVSI